MSATDRCQFLWGGSGREQTAEWVQCSLQQQLKQVAEKRSRVLPTVERIKTSLALAFRSLNTTTTTTGGPAVSHTSTPQLLRTITSVSPAALDNGLSDIAQQISQQLRGEIRARPLRTRRFGSTAQQFSSGEAASARTSCTQRQRGTALTDFLGQEC